MGTTGSLVTQAPVWLSSGFTLLFCVCSFSKQPHNILQKRLMETNLSKLRGSRGSWSPKGDLSSQINKLNQTKLGSSGKMEDEELIVVSCQCAGKELKAVVDTGSQHNLMSSACLDRLG